MELIRKKQFVAITLDLDDEIFIVYVAFVVSSNLSLKFYVFQKV